MRLVSFRRQAIVCFRLDDPPRNLGLTTHRVDGDERTCDFQHLQQFGNRRDLVTLGVHDDLSQTNMIGGRPGADHMDRRLTRCSVKTTA